MYSRWWGGWRSLEETESLTILDLINYGTVNLKLAGLLWFLMDYRPSVMVAAGPSFAGKTTLLNTLLDFLRPEIRKIHLHGYTEDFKFLEHSRPDSVYLVADEISNHSFEYLWGYRARKTFELLSQGYALGGTIHARNAKEVVLILHEYLGLNVTLLSHLDVIVTLRVISSRTFEEDPIRRVDTVSILNKTNEGLVLEMLAAWNQKDGSFDFVTDDTLQTVLNKKFSARNNNAAAESATRERFLEKLLVEPKLSREEIRKAILEFYRSPS